MDTIQRFAIYVIILVLLVWFAKAQVTTSLTIISPVDCINCTWEIVNNTINVWV